jgi:osmotically-inducible protein OsmY
MKIAAKLTSCVLALTCAYAIAADPQNGAVLPTPAATAKSTPGAENTEINQRDKGGATKIPQNQGNSDQDRALLAAVRRAIVADKSLSTQAHNVKVLVENGTVTLRGPVKNAEEKAKVESLAQNVAGITGTRNQLDLSTTASTQ